MDPRTGGKKLQFVDSGTFNTESCTPSPQADKPTNGFAVSTPQNDDGIPPIEVGEKIFKKNLRRKRNKWTLIITFTSLVLIIIFITIAYLVARQHRGDGGGGSGMQKCKDIATCSLKVVETIPPVLKYPVGTSKHEKISKHWSALVRSATSSINILSMYWTMKRGDVSGGPYEQEEVGERFIADIKDAARRGVQVRIVQDKGSDSKDTSDLAQHPNVNVRKLDVHRLLNAGIIHTKLFTVDGKRAYVGSANFDWRALTEVKELGIVLYECPCLVADVTRIFESNWMLATEDSKIPKHWPSQYWTRYNKNKPITVEASKERALTQAYWSTSPPAFCAPKRTSDIEAILDLINKAKKFVHISVMDYVPAMIYMKPKRYWDTIDRALRTAAFDRGISVRLLTSKWNHTRDQQTVLLKSLSVFGKVPGINGSLEVRQFEMPGSGIPYTRVSHSKYMVTDEGVFVSTSNWSGDYFENTAGVSLVITEPNKKTDGMLEDLRNTFERDWSSEYATPL